MLVVFGSTKMPLLKQTQGCAFCDSLWLKDAARFLKKQFN
jgi:hypothetical protein